MDEAAFGAQLVTAAGTAATYTPPGGVGVATVAVLERTVRQRADGYGVERLTIAHLPSADVPAPVVGAQLEIGAADYAVEALDEADDATVAVVVRRL